MPRAPLNATFYAHELFMVTAILKKADLKDSSSVHIQLFETLKGLKSEKTLSLNVERVENEQMFKVCAKREISHLSLLGSDQRSSIIGLSVKYGVLSKHTAIFGIHKNVDSSVNELITV